MTTTTPASAAGLCARAALLSGILARPVNGALLWQVRDEVFASQWSRDTPEALRGVGLLHESATARESAERINADFARLFVGPEARVEPCESRFREADVAELEALYASVGFQAHEQLPADHLANELAFFSQLTMLSDNPERQLTEFARNHLRPWAGECLAEISLRAATLFYQGIGAIGMDYIESLPTR